MYFVYLFWYKTNKKYLCMPFKIIMKIIKFKNVELISDFNWYILKHYRSSLKVFIKFILI